MKNSILKVRIMRAACCKRVWNWNLYTDIILGCLGGLLDFTGAPSPPIRVTVFKFVHLIGERWFESSLGIFQYWSIRWKLWLIFGTSLVSFPYRVTFHPLKGYSALTVASVALEHPLKMKYQKSPRTWTSSVEIDTESDANDGEPLLSDASVSSKRSFG